MEKEISFLFEDIEVLVEPKKDRINFSTTIDGKRKTIFEVTYEAVVSVALETFLLSNIAHIVMQRGKSDFAYIPRSNEIN